MIDVPFARRRPPSTPSSRPTGKGTGVEPSQGKIPRLRDVFQPTVPGILRFHAVNSVPGVPRPRRGVENPRCFHGLAERKEPQATAFNSAKQRQNAQQGKPPPPAASSDPDGRTNFAVMRCVRGSEGKDHCRLIMRAAASLPCSYLHAPRRIVEQPQPPLAEARSKSPASFSSRSIAQYESPLSARCFRKNRLAESATRGAFGQL